MGQKVLNMASSLVIGLGGTPRGEMCISLKKETVEYHQNGHNCWNFGQYAANIGWQMVL